MARSQRGRRVTHIIRKNATNYMPSYRVFVDCEALRTKTGPRSERQTLWFGWAYYERVRDDYAQTTPESDWLRFTFASEFWGWLTSKVSGKRRVIIYAHNLQYDAALLSLSTQAELTGWKMVSYVPDPHLLWVEFRKAGTTLLFLDTLNYFNCSLAYLGESIGFSKAKMPPQDGSRESWDAYCKRDVEVLISAMHSYYELITTLDLGHYQRTAASQAFGAFRHRFMQHPILCLADDRISSHERNAYHGGRTEVFYDRERVGNTHCLDVNAMFPAMMATHLYPVKKEASGARCTTEQLAEMLNWGCVIADVSLDTDEPCYPYHTGERIVYPVGTFSTTLTTRELRYALYHGHIVSVRQWVLYTDALLFQNFVLELHRLRWQYKDEDNAAFSYMCKNISNSLYGKFGQNGRRWVQCEEGAIEGVSEYWAACGLDRKPLLHRRRFGVWMHQLRDMEAFESFPAIAAHITADARLYLWQMIGFAGREHVYYTDTDSIYCDDIGMERLHGYLDSRKLGALKLEGTYQSVHFRAPKDYRLDGKRRTKGVRDSAWELRDGYYEQEQFESYDQVLARGDDGYIDVSRIAKRVNRRNHQSSGENVGWRSPLVLTSTPSS